MNGSKWVDSNHSHKKWKDSPETLVVYIEIYLWYLRFIERTKTPELVFKNMFSSEVDQPLTGAFHAVMDKKRLIYFKLQRSQIENEYSTSRILFYKDCGGYKCQFYTTVGAPSRLVS